MKLPVLLLSIFLSVEAMYVNVQLEFIDSIGNDDYYDYSYDSNKDDEHFEGVEGYGVEFNIVNSGGGFGTELNNNYGGGPGAEFSFRYAGYGGESDTRFRNGYREGSTTEFNGGFNAGSGTGFNIEYSAGSGAGFRTGPRAKSGAESSAGPRTKSGAESSVGSDAGFDVGSGAGYSGKSGNGYGTGPSRGFDTWPHTGDSITVNAIAPFLTNWIYSMDDEVISEGTEDFCNSTPITSGGLAIQIFCTSLLLESTECPIKRRVFRDQIHWTWKEDIDFENIFKNTSIASASGGSSEDSPSAAKSGSMKMTLQIKNEFIKSKFILTNA